jgi:hypothetical protein
VPAPGGVVDVGAIRLAGRIGLLHCGDATAIRAGLVATGLFLADDIGELTPCAIPTLAQLLEFDAVLAWTDAPFSDPVAVGNVLGSYNDQGGGVVLATFAFTNAWRIAGVISNRSPFTLSGTMGGGSGLLNLAASMTSHPIMQGVTDTTQPYFTNANYTNPVLRMFSTLIAVDTTSRRVVAVSASGTVVGVNIFPGHALPAPIQRLFANALDFVR